MEKIDFNENCPDCPNNEVCPGLLQKVREARANLYALMMMQISDKQDFEELETALNNFDTVRIYGKCMK